MTSVKHEVIREESAENIKACLSCTEPTCNGDCWRMRSTAPFSPRPRVVVRCVDTGDVFPTIAAAAKFAGRDPAAIRSHLRGETVKCGGLKFERVGKEGEAYACT